MVVYMNKELERGLKFLEGYIHPDELNEGDREFFGDFIENEFVPEKENRIELSAVEKERIKKDSGYVCQCCGSEGNLEIHHIDGNPGNRDKFNLIPICKDCHNKTKGNDFRNNFIIYIPYFYRNRLLLYGEDHEIGKSFLSKVGFQAEILNIDFNYNKKILELKKELRKIKNDSISIEDHLAICNNYHEIIESLEKLVKKLSGVD